MTIKRYNTNQTLIDSGFRQLSGGTLTLSGNTVIASAGTLSYATCMHEFYTARSVTDADFVTGLTSSISNIGQPQQVIFRDVSGITGATGFLFDEATSGVTVPNLSISITPPDDTLGEYILTWDETFKQVRKIPAATSVGLQTAENGLTATGSVVRLGGTLNQCTVIDGANEHQMIFRNLGGACVATTEGNIVLDSRLDTGGVYIKSQSGTGNTAASFAGAVGIEIEYEPNRFVIHDNRSPFNQTGIEYAANYSSRYTNRSLVDKEYVDTIASGLQPKQAVAVATTGETNNIDLLETGLTTYIIDGVEIGEGVRVLIKDQNDATENGIYIITGGTWQRSDDFDEDSEVVQGAYTFVVSGQTNESTQWVVTTPDPIAVDITPINWVLFNRISNIVAGSGINVVNDEGVFKINLGGELTQDAVFSGGTLNYADDYSGSFSANTLITKEYADTLIASGGTYNLSSPSAIEVGGISAGTTLTGKTAFELFEELLVPELFPTLTNPSTVTSLFVGVTSISNNSLYEIGCSIGEIIVCSTFNRGSINPQYCSDSPFRSGDANSYVYTGTDVAGTYSCTNTSMSANTSSYTILVGSNTWGTSTCYDEGVQPKSTKGNDFNSPLPSGQTSASIRTIVGTYPLFVTTSNITTLTQQSLVNMSTGNDVAFTLVAETGGNKQKFDIPNAWTGAPTNRPLIGIETFNTVSNQWEYQGGGAAASLTFWNTSTTTHTIQGNVINYTRYIYNSTDRSSIQIRLKF